MRSISTLRAPSNSFSAAMRAAVSALWKVIDIQASVLTGHQRTDHSGFGSASTASPSGKRKTFALSMVAERT